MRGSGGEGNKAKRERKRKDELFHEQAGCMKKEVAHHAPLGYLCRAGQFCPGFRQCLVDCAIAIFVNADLYARRIDDRKCQACPVGRCNGQCTLMRIAGSLLLEVGNRFHRIQDITSKARHIARHCQVCPVGVQARECRGTGVAVRGNGPGYSSVGRGC